MKRAVPKRKPRTYAEERRMLLIELRIMRLSQPARRIVKHMQRLMRSLRWRRKEGVL